MKINFYYVYVDYSINNLILLYSNLKKHIELYANQGIVINLINVNDESLDSIVDSVRNCDVCVIDSLITAAALHQPYVIPNNTILKNIKTAEQYNDIFEAVLNFSQCKILFAQSFDLHWHGIRFDHLSRFDALLWLYEKKPLLLNDIPKAYQEDWFFKHDNTYDVWSKICKTVKSRAEIPFSVDRSKTNIKNKFFDYTVAGCNYNTRIIASKSLAETSLTKAPYMYGEYLFTAISKQLKKFGASNDFINKFYIYTRKTNYRFFIEHSCAAFACGSGLSYPVRKFFQIPSYGSLLLAYPCVGFRDYGFIDGVNCITTTPEDAGNNVRKILSNKGAVEQITKKGFEDVLKEHSVENRINQIMECIIMIAKGHSINAQYIDGKYEITKI